MVGVVERDEKLAGIGRKSNFGFGPVKGGGGPRDKFWKVAV